MTTVNMHEAKTQLSRLIARAERGEEIVIARAGRPAVRLVPAQPLPRRREPGALKGRMTLNPGFDAPLPEAELAAWEA